MKSNVFLLENKNALNPEFEFVERKGAGHPDTLADGLAERLSFAYSQYTKEKFGVILHHNFDKTWLLWWASFVEFWKWYLTQPIRVLLTWRASTKFWATDIDVKSLLIEEAEKFFLEKFPNLDPKKDLSFLYLLSNQSSPWKVDEEALKEWTRKYWFEPRWMEDIKELNFLWSNDTSLGCGYFPYSILESLVLQIENTLNSDHFKVDKPRLWSDIKIMWTRFNDEIDITLCVPQIASHVLNLDEYKLNLEIIRNAIDWIFASFNVDWIIKSFNFHINTRDDYETCELYLTAIWSSIESWDEWLVWRGNRINGVISPMKPMSMEWAAGKNPVYHIWKIYYIAAQKLAEKIYQLTWAYSEVFLVSQSWRHLLDPWKILVYSDFSRENKDAVYELIENEIKSIPEITDNFLKWEMLY